MTMQPKLESLFSVTGTHQQHWLLFDRVVQQITLQSENRPNSAVDPDSTGKETELSRTTDPDVAPLTIDVQKIVKLLVKEEELVAARLRAEELEKENSDVQARLSKKEQEKEDLETSLVRMRERLEKESANHSQAVQRALSAEMRVEDLQHRFTQEQQERLRLERLATDDQKVAGLQGCGQISPQVTKSPPPPPPLMPSLNFVGKFKIF